MPLSDLSGKAARPGGPARYCGFVRARKSARNVAGNNLRTMEKRQENKMKRNMMLTTVWATVLAAVMATGVAMTSVPAAAFTGEALAKDAKISLAEARAIALKAYAGEIVAEELEKEKGGSGLRYSFDIKNGRVTHEVGVDAKTGKVLENIVEGARHD
jgi:uncharacterized membrane protein YkoI